MWTKYYIPHRINRPIHGHRSSRCIRLSMGSGIGSQVMRTFWARENLRRSVSKRSYGSTVSLWNMINFNLDIKGLYGSWRLCVDVDILAQCHSSGYRFCAVSRAVLNFHHLQVVYKFHRLLSKGKWYIQLMVCRSHITQFLS